MVGYGPFSLCVIHKEGLNLSIGDIHKLMMMMMMIHKALGMYNVLPELLNDTLKYFILIIPVCSGH
jgi:hypothetical protein